VSLKQILRNCLHRVNHCKLLTMRLCQLPYEQAAAPAKYPYVPSAASGNTILLIIRLALSTTDNICNPASLLNKYVILINVMFPAQHSILPT